MKIQILTSPGCGHGARALDLVADILRQSAPGAEVETITVASLEDAIRWSFPGSPTIRVDGIDIDPEPPTGVGLG
jgi:glutaredoxin